MTLEEYMKQKKLKRYQVVLSAGITSTALKNALEKKTTPNIKLREWCDKRGVTIGRAEPKTAHNAIEFALISEDGSYLAMVIKGISQGCRELRVFTPSQKATVTNYLDEQNIDYNIAPFNKYCEHIKIVQESIN